MWLSKKNPFYQAAIKLFAIVALVVAFTFLYVVVAFAAPADYTIEVNSQALTTKIDKNGNVHHGFKSVKSRIIVKDGGVNLIDNNLNSVFGPKFHPVTGVRRPICNSSDFYANERGLLTCDAIANWAKGGE